MYTPQTTMPSATKYFLDALNTGEAQLKTPDGAPTVFAQKLQQGIAQGLPAVQGMPQAKQEFQQAVPSVMRNMQQQQMQQMVQQAMQPKPVGIEGVAGPRPPGQGVAGVPAQNMQRMQQMAEGGVVGFAGDGEFGSVVPEVVALDELRVAEAKRKREDAERQKMLEFLEQAGSPLADKYRRTTPAPAAPARPPAAAQQPKPAVSRPTAPTPPAAVPQGGIASAIERPSIESVMQGVRMAMGQDDQYENKMRDIARREEAKRAGMPDLSAQGIAALQEAEKQRQADLQRGKFHALFEGWKGNTSAYGNFKEASRQAELQNKMAIMKFQEAQQARELGEFDRAKALEKEVQAHKDKQSQIEQGITASAASLLGHTYTADVGARERGLDREAADKRARDRNAALVAAAKAKGVKPPPGMGMGDLKALQDMVIAEFNPKRLGPQALTFLNSLPNGAQLVRDIQNGNVKPGSSQWEKEVAPKLVLGAEIYKQSLLRQTKFGAQPMPYSAAAAALGVSPAADEDED